MKVVLLLLVLLASAASAAPPTIVSCPGPAQIGAAQSAAGITAKAINGHGQQSLGFEVRANAGTATVQVVACCTGSCNLIGGDWAPVGTSGSLTTGIAQFFKVDWPPACLWAVSVTAPTTLSADTFVVCGGP